MTGTDGRQAFFTREAGEYLEALATLVGGGEPPPGEELVRLARSVRGAAMLAGPPAFTGAAARLEDLAKLARTGDLPWETAGEPIRAAITRLKALLSQVPAWAGEQDHAAAELASDIEAVMRLATAAATPRPRPAIEPTMELGAFVAREARSLATALQAAAAAAGSGSATFPATLRPIRLAMRSLRGLAGLADCVSLPDLLDALDAAADELATAPVTADATSQMLAAAHRAVSRIEREAEATGRSPADLPEVEEFAERLFETLVRAPGVMGIEALVVPGTIPAPQASIPLSDPAELAALGERLRQAAAQLRGAPTATAARLQQFVLLTTIRNVPGGLGRRPAGSLLAALARAIEEGVSHDDTLRFADALDRASDLLSTVASGPLAFRDAAEAVAAEFGAGDRMAIVPIESLFRDDEPADAVVPVASLLADAGEEVVPIETLLHDEPVASEPAPAADRPGEADAGVVPIDTLLEGEPGDGAIVAIDDLLETPPTVPIASLLEPDGSVVPIETLLVAAAARVGPFAPASGDRTPLERSLSSYSTRVRAGTPVLPLALVTQPAGGAPTSRWSRAAALEIEAELGAIPIDDLVYHGKAALDRAEEVRRDLEAALRFASSELDRVDPLVRELLDLVPLALIDKP